MKRHWFTLFVALLLGALLFACSGGGDSDTEPAAEADTATETSSEPAEDSEMEEEAEEAAADCFMEVEDGATITFSGWGNETEQQVYRDSIERFKAVCPAVTVNYEPIPDEFQTKLKAAMAGGTAPDVFYVDDQLMTAFAPNEQLLALDEYMAEAGVSRDDFIAPLLTIFTLDGQTYGLPKDWGTLGLIYLPEAFAEAGIDEPTADWTWDDLRAAAQAIAENTDYAGYCQGADWARFAPWAFSNGGAYATEDYASATLDTPEIKEMAAMQLEMFQEGSLQRASDLSAGWCGEAIGKELAGLTLEGGWMVNYMRTDFPDVEWKAVLLPQGPDNRADVIFTNAIGVNAFTQYPRAAAAFTIFVTGRDNQGEIVETGFAYSTHPDQAELVQDENDKAIAEGGLLPDSRVAYWGPNTGRVNDAVSQALERIFLNDQSVDEAFAQAQEEAQAALDEVR
ncbi:MAG: extracellular solute-binding protein [Anaerolineae bacterium]|nr:extracellular solute-binding protein [Anaerolineae bacterium]